MLQVATDILKQMGISYNAGLEKELAPTYNKLQKIIPPLEWPHLAPYIKAINELKQEKNAVILAHNYQTADIFHTIADVKGDSLQLAKEASKTTADIIVQCGVYFMAETSKLLNPQKKVLIPDEKAGCSLADSITAQDVRDLRQAYPHTPIIAYVNSSCEVKAEADICCTSSNALDIVNGLGAKQVICIPDEYLAKNIAQLTNINVISYKGRCEVHERFTAKELQILRQKEDNLKIIAHPECAPDVIKEADFSGSTQAMIKWVETEQPKKNLDGHRMLYER